MSSNLGKGAEDWWQETPIAIGPPAGRPWLEKPASPLVRRREIKEIKGVE
jgi:hypothetical protein